MTEDTGSQSGAGRRGRVAAGFVVAAIVLSVLGVAAYVAWPRTGSPRSPVEFSVPQNVQAIAGEGRVTVTWDSVGGALAYHLYTASEAGVTKAGYAGMHDGVRYSNVVSPYTIAGLSSGKTYYFRVTAENAGGESDESGEASATPVSAPGHVNLYVTGLVELDSGAPAVGASVALSAESGIASAQGMTGEDGRFNLGIALAFPDRVLAQVTYRGVVGPSATGFRWSPLLAAGGAVDVGRIVLPDASDKALTMAGTSAWSPDGAIGAMNLPPNVASLWARPYDPDVFPDVFPGDLAEGRDRPLNSVVFTWISALDASGQPVVDLASPATVRMRVPEPQWVDLEDLQSGNSVIDIPIYSLDYETGYWVREAGGKLTDTAGTPIPESEEMTIRSGAYAWEVYAEFLATHFSWWNVDYSPTDCKPDFGDAVDPPYPTSLASDGARHLDICRAWLGAWVDGEEDANSPDSYDDGLIAESPLTVRVSNWNWSSRLYLNALVDENVDGDWTDAGEWVVQNVPLSVSERRGIVVKTDFVWKGDSWLRLTLTGTPIQDYVGTGEFAIGETEDYPLQAYRLDAPVIGGGTVTSDPPGINCRWTGGTCFMEIRKGTLVNLTAMPDDEHGFIEWHGDCSGSDPWCVVRMDRSRHVVAVFMRTTYFLSTWVIGNGTVTSDPPGIECRWMAGTCSAGFRPGALVNLTATADTGQSFREWQGDCSGSDPWCIVGMDRHRSVVAVFTKPTYVISVWVIGYGTVGSEMPGIDCRWTSGTCSAEFRSGALVNLSAAPDIEHSFMGWAGGCSGSSALCPVTMDRDYSVYAAFTGTYHRLSVYVYGTDPGGNQSVGGGRVSSEPRGIDCRSNGTGGELCATAFPTDAIVLLTATPDSGWTFVGWSNDCTGSGWTCTVTMGLDKWVVAEFRKM